MDTVSNSDEMEGQFCNSLNDDARCRAVGLSASLLLCRLRRCVTSRAR